jgi:hypothetical protein
MLKTDKTTHHWTYQFAVMWWQKPVSAVTSLQPEQWKCLNEITAVSCGDGSKPMQLLLMSIPLKQNIDIDQYSSHMFLSLLDLVPVNRISPAV